MMNNTNKNILVWLDDCRNPFTNVQWVSDYSPIANPDIVVWLKSYNQFTYWIEMNGLPAAICFDHDLGETGENEKTGYDCAKWLVDYCIDNNKKLPLWNIQSSNPAGADNINGLLTNFSTKYKWED